MKVVGFGDLIFDQILSPSDTGFAINGQSAQKLKYVGGRGGGSVWNVLANLAAEGFRCAAAGWGGADVFGRLASEELTALGVDTSSLVLKPQTDTRLIFELQGVGENSDHAFTKSCPACGFRHKTRISDRRSLIPIRSDTSASILVLDDLNRSAPWDLFQGWRKEGDLAVAILDHASSYRYTPIGKILGRLQSLDTIFMKDRVYESFKRRAAQAGFGDIHDLLLPKHRARILVSTQGALGAEGWVCAPGGTWTHFQVPAPKVAKPLDTAGAGDAFLAAFLKNYQLAFPSISLLNEPERATNAIRDALNRAAGSIAPVLMERGARGHLPLHNTTHLPQENFQHHGGCRICGQVQAALSPARPDNRKVGMRDTGGRLLRSRAMFSLEGRALEQARKLLTEKTRTYVVGTGGSYPAAVFIAYALSRYGNHHAEAVRPHELIARGSRADTVIVVSSSGKTPDCGRALEVALKRGASRAILVTSAEHPRLAQYGQPYGLEVEVIRVKGRERGFISFSGTVVPALVFAVAAGVDPFEALKFCEQSSFNIPLSHQIARSLLENPVVHAIGSAWTWPALLDLESKFTEGNLGTLHLHEAKDFSHGRFMRVIKSGRDSPILLFRTGEDDHYFDFMAQKLEALPNCHIVESPFKEISGGLDMMFIVQNMILEIAGYLGKDVSRPAHIPRKGLDIYHWTDEQ